MLWRESTPAGFLLIGYFSFPYFPVSALTFLPPPWIASLYSALYCSPYTVDVVSHSHSLSPPFFNSLLYTLWAPSSCRVQLWPPASGIYRHLTLSVPSSPTSSFQFPVQLFYIVIPGPCSVVLTLSRTRTVFIMGCLSCWRYNNLSVF